MNVKLIIHTPTSAAQAVRDAVAKAGAGNIGGYTHCSFSVRGTGRFIPSEDTNAFIGKPHELQVVEEDSIEVICPKSIAKQVITAAKQAHPYEEPVIEILQLMSEEDL